MALLGTRGLGSERGSVGKMRRLSARAAWDCEHATTTRCRCRCGGALHGAGRTTLRLDVEDLHERREPEEHDPKQELNWARGYSTVTGRAIPPGARRSDR